jgi:hypothetical protein
MSVEQALKEYERLTKKDVNKSEAFPEGEEGVISNA